MRRHKDIITIAIVAAIIVLGLGALVCVMIFSGEIRQFKNQMLYFAGESYNCKAEYDGTNVIVEQENKKALTDLLIRTKRKVVIGKVNTTDEIHYIYTRDDGSWTLDLYQTDRDCVKVVIDGEDHYSFYLNDNGDYERYILIAKPEGWKIENTVMNK